MQQKEGAPTLCNSMDGTGEHYAKWNEPGGERQIPHDLIVLGVLKGSGYQIPQVHGEVLIYSYQGETKGQCNIFQS